MPERPCQQLYEVKIVAIQLHDSSFGWGAAGATTIEWPDGTRERICGIQGQIGDTFQRLRP